MRWCLTIGFSNKCGNSFSLIMRKVDTLAGWARLDLKVLTAGGADFRLVTSSSTYCRGSGSLNTFYDRGGSAIVLIGSLKVVGTAAVAVTSRSLCAATSPNCGEARPEISTDWAILFGLLSACSVTAVFLGASHVTCSVNLAGFWPKNGNKTGASVASAGFLTFGATEDRK